VAVISVAKPATVVYLNSLLNPEKNNGYHQGKDNCDVNQAGTLGHSEDK
jgi:hypothetical protein